MEGPPGSIWTRVVIVLGLALTFTALFLVTFVRGSSMHESGAASALVSAIFVAGYFSSALSPNVVLA